MNHIKTEGVTFEQEEIIEKPFSSEIVDPRHHPIINIEKNDDGTYSIKADGKVLQGYERIEGCQIGKTLNPDVSEVRMRVGTIQKNDQYEHEYEYQFFNTKNLEEEYPLITCRTQSFHHRDDILVNGKQWESLNGQKIYWNGHRVAFDLDDPDAIKVAFATNNDETKYRKDVNSVIVNNRPWSNTFRSIGSLKAKQGHVAAIVSTSEQYLNSLYIDDVKWILSEKDMLPSKDTEDQRNDNPFDIEKFDMNNKTVAVVSDKTGKRTERSVIVGNMYGKTGEWKNTFVSVDKIVTDKKSDRVAVIASKVRNGEKNIVIDDVICQTKESIDTLEDFEFDDGVIFVQYITPLGKVVAEKIKLIENAEEIQKRNILLEKTASELAELNFLLKTKNLTPKDALEKVEESDVYKESLANANKEISELKNKFNDLEMLNENFKKESLNDKYNIKSLENTLEREQETLSGVREIIKERVTKKPLVGYTLSNGAYTDISKLLKLDK
ncbi:hypothetical protein IPN41_04240 [Candidatus Falkowbacteria bacterium]|nr:MAG: hypothetical protein IPN41_04240 [Candidatus Falkowbacteria bacterium]